MDEETTNASGASQTETAVLLDTEPDNTDDTDPESRVSRGTTRSRRRRRDEEVSEEERKSFRYIYQKLLNLLPAIGDDDDDEEGPDSEANRAALRFGAKQMVLLVIPVFICMAIVVLIQLSVEETVGSSGSSGQLIYTPFKEDSTSNAGLILLIALGNVAIVIILVVLMTILLVCLYKYRCYKIIQGWLMTATAILLFVFSSFFFVEVLQVRGLPLDWLSFLLLIWNFGATGVMAIHWKGPLRLQQGYLIFCSALSANIFIKYLPNWTAWLLLFAISIYDLVAVLCPKGPLRVLVETAKERNENLFPSLIYSTTMIWIVGMADNPGSKNKAKKQSDSSSSNSEEEHDDDDDDDVRMRRDEARDLTLQQSLAPDERRLREGMTRRRVNADTGEETDSTVSRQEQPNDEDEEPRGFRLGLGDFIFYSVLVGKAAHDSHGDWAVISSCFVAIMIGLCMTTLILGMVRRALPALPISIIFGLIFYFTSQYLFGPLAAVLATTQTFV